GEARGVAAKAKDEWVSAGDVLLLVAAHQGHVAVKTGDKSLLAELRKSVDLGFPESKLDGLCLVGEYQARLEQTEQARKTFGEALELVKKGPKDDFQVVDFGRIIRSQARCGVYAKDPSFFALAKKTAEGSLDDLDSRRQQSSVAVGQSRYAAVADDASYLDLALENPAFQLELEDLFDTFLAEDFRQVLRMQVRAAVNKRDKSRLGQLRDRLDR